ncbi:hypothetical protein BAE44_0005422 [Dichanthelium oligosanthes]|uniref:Uncharacterized protein n=1 Tax=Dichanthelium oligosanthes TaxID=888268 RepID=A0A1E5W850_9POAL|nr:hypothetical protein BAE44_0005422 [Dichanthelium oligosanthes]
MRTLQLMAVRGEPPL